LADEVPAPNRAVVEDWTFPGVDDFPTKRPDDAQMFRRLVHSRFVEGSSAIERMRHAKALLDDAAVAIDDMIRKGKLEIDTNDLDTAIKVRQDLEYIYVNPEGREVLDRIAAKPYKTRIEPGAGKRPLADKDPVGNPPSHMYDFDNGTEGAGASSRVDYDPSVSTGPDCPPDTILFHELEHAANNAEGRNKSSRLVTDPNGQQRWEKIPPPEASERELPGRTQQQRQQYAKDRYTDLEEYNTVRKENQYRDQYRQKPRWGHYNMSLMPGS
jgi:hypothetical protein